MSAYMVPNENLCKIAGYLKEMLDTTNRMGVCAGIKAIHYKNSVVDVFAKLTGAFDTRSGEYRADAIHKTLHRMNYTAVAARYGNCEKTYEPYDGKPVDIREETRPEWQCRLFTILRNFLYQCSEGTVPESEVYKALQEICDGLAYQIAAETAERDWGCFWSTWKPEKQGERKSQMQD